MATTFDVYPGRVELPTTRQVLSLGRVKLDAYLREMGLPQSNPVQVQLLTSGTHEDQGLLLDAPFACTANAYFWFTVQDVAGGTSAYFKQLDLEGFEQTFGLPIEADRTDLSAVFDTARISGHWWYFRRSAGQPALINILYGCLASALAELTHGVVYSDDGAWDFERFPALPQEFDRWFMRPEFALSLERKQWAERIRDRLLEEMISE
ncbi:hypothetical protein [Deinococcus sedimenti]|uniref:hypothetical protein n=1 Tax=Deinococcus sedimenti TaxID=1867090 RepID=UPI00166305BF|nr:hypothetical protein [Deinococcus sedimenti]